MQQDPNSEHDFSLLPDFNVITPALGGGNLTFLSLAEDREFLLRVSEHENTSPSILELLVKHSDPDIRCAVAVHPNTPFSSLKEMASDPDPTVRYQLAECIHIDPQILAVLCEDENPYVACRAYKTLVRLEEEESLNNKQLSKRIFFVEDDEFLKNWLRIHIQTWALFDLVGSADEGQDVLAQVDILRPDLILMDIGLPDENGIAITKEVKEKWPGIKVIILTACDKSEQILQAFEAGADGYFLKTTDYKLLEVAAREVLSNKIWIDPAVSATVLRFWIDKMPANKVLDEQPHPSANRAYALLYEQAEAYRHQGKHRQAILLCEALIAIAELENAEADVVALSALALLGRLLYSQAAYDKCEQVYLQLLQTRQQEWQKSDISVERILRTLGQVALDSGNWSRAQTYQTWRLRVGDTWAVKDACDKLRTIEQYKSFRSCL